MIIMALMLFVIVVSYLLMFSPTTHGNISLYF
jgi:hypothetical protein